MNLSALMHDVRLLRNDDPDPLKLLKRKLAIAIVEEDYQQAITLRDHPYMQMHWEVGPSAFAFSRLSSSVLRR